MHMWRVREMVLSNGTAVKECNCLDTQRTVTYIVTAGERSQLHNGLTICTRSQ